MKATWEMEFNEGELAMLAFCVEGMVRMLKEGIKDGGVCGCGSKKSVLAQLKRDVKTANNILAGIYKGQLNLSVASEVAKQAKTPRHGRAKRRVK